MSRIISQDLFPDHRPVGRPRTSTKTRAQQLRINQKNYRLRQKLKNKNDNALSKKTNILELLIAEIENLQSNNLQNYSGLSYFDQSNLIQILTAKLNTTHKFLAIFANLNIEQIELDKLQQSAHGLIHITQLPLPSEILSINSNQG